MSNYPRNDKPEYNPNYYTPIQVYNAVSTKLRVVGMSNHTIYSITKGINDELYRNSISSLPTNYGNTFNSTRPPSTNQTTTGNRTTSNRTTSNRLNRFHSTGEYNQFYNPYNRTSY